jgi:H+/Na+-translocating ferredoxin:NAD+ oxidoreductase subunit C
LTNEYPQADPTMLLYRMFRRRLRPSRLPTEQGVVLFDAAAAIATARAARGEPMIFTWLAVHDHISAATHFLSVPIGTPLSWILKQVAPSAPQDNLELRGGALLRDIRIDPYCVVAGGELVLHVTASNKQFNPDPCIKCSWCVESCPTRLYPAGLLEAAQHEDFNLADRYGLEACIECGVCSYICPSHLPLLHSIRAMAKRGAALHDPVKAQDL